MSDKISSVVFWLFPPEDYEEWVELVKDDYPQVPTYDQYKARIDEDAKNRRQNGEIVLISKMTVKEMREGLASRGLDNTPDNRNLVFGDTSLLRVKGVRDAQ